MVRVVLRVTGGVMADLLELTRIAQIALEMHRVDPDDEQTWQDYLKARAERDTAWCEHVARFPHP